MRYNFLQKAIGGFILAAFISLMLTCGAELSHGTTTTKPNSLGVVIDQTNPNAAVAGTILEAGVGADKDGREATIIRFHPIGTYGLLDQSIVFCGDQSELITSDNGNAIPGDLVFIYRRQAARLIDNVPCYELKSVSRIMPDKKRFK